MLAYFLLYQDSGLPLYSKCYSEFCYVAFQDPALITVFLKSLENFAEQFSEENVLESIKMGNTTMFFRKTLPSGHSLVLGLTKPNQQLVDDIFQIVQDVLETEYKDINWKRVGLEFAKEFEKRIIERALIPILIEYHIDFEDNCKLGDQCALKTLASDVKQGTIWAIIEKHYKEIRTKSS